MIKIVCVVLAAYAAICALVYFMQARLLYFPSRTLAATPADAGLEYEEIALRAEDGTRLSAWFLPAAAARGAILFCHGNAGNISHRLESLQLFHQLGFAVLIFDYRGYGQSAGSPSEEGTAQDAAAAWQYLRRTRQLPPERIVVFGRSLGGAVAARLAASEKPGALIIESAFTSMPDLAAGLYPWLPARWLCRFKYDTRLSLQRLGCPVLIVHSREDEIVPFGHGERLFATAKEPKTFLEIHGGHNGAFLSSGKVYTEGLARFLRAQVE